MTNFSNYRFLFALCKRSTLYVFYTFKIKKMKISQFIGTCSDIEIGLLATKNGRKSSYNNAKKAIKSFSIDLYNDLNMDLFNPWHEHTNIKTIKGIKNLQRVNTCIDYLFIIK